MFVLSFAFAGEVSPSLAYQHTQLLDQHQSPLPYDGHALRLGLKVQPTIGSVQTWVSAHLATGTGGAVGVQRSRFSVFQVDVAAQVGGVAPVWRHERGTLSVGGSFSSDFELMNGMANHVWGLALNQIAGVVRYDHRFGPRRLRFEAALPVVGWVTRHNWSLDPVVPDQQVIPAFYSENTRFRAMGQVLDVRGAVTFTVPVGSFEWSTALEAKWFGAPYPRRVNRLGVAVSTGPTFRFGERP